MGVGDPNFDWKIRRSLVLSLALVALGWLAGSPAPIQAQGPGPGPGGYFFTKIVDTSTPVPGGSGTFGGPEAFRGGVVQGGEVAFIGATAGGSVGVYLSSGGTLQRVADGSFTFAGSNVAFAAYPGLDLDGGTVLFSVISDVVGGPQAVYRGDGDGLELIADSSTPRPGTGETFQRFGAVALSADDLLFSGGVDPFFLAVRQNALYRVADGELEILADESTPIPAGTGTFPSYGYVDLTADGWAVSLPRMDVSVEDGIYRNVGLGGLRRIADLTTSIPDGAGSFTSFRSLDMSGSQVAFVATGSGGQFGVYVDDGGLRRVVDTSTQVPGTGETFLGFSGPVALDGDEVIFSGFWAGAGYGLFSDLEGVMGTVLLRGQLLDGRTVDTAVVEPNGFAAGQMAVKVTFTDQTSGLYLARRLAPGGCNPSATTLCLADGRFRVSARWARPNGEQGDGFGTALSGDSGTFYFFRPQNVEMLVKILNACQQATPRFWVFAAGLTNLDVLMTVEDTDTGTERTYRNPASTPFQPIQDTQAFETCP